MAAIDIFGSPYLETLKSSYTSTCLYLTICHKEIAKSAEADLWPQVIQCLIPVVENLKQIKHRKAKEFPLWPYTVVCNKYPYYIDWSK